MKYALIENNVVRQIALFPKTGYVPVDSSVFPGFVRSGDEFTNPSPPDGTNIVTQMKTVWDSAPVWMRGPYEPLRTAVVRLAGRDPAALVELLNSVEPTAAIAADPARLAEFNSGLDTLRQIANDA